jgi:hypothetical protein
LKASEGEEREGVVEGGIGGDARDAEFVGGSVGERRADDGVAAAGVSEFGVVDEVDGEGVGLVGDCLLAEDAGKSRDSACTEGGAGDGSAAVGEWGYGFFDFVVVGVTAKEAVAVGEDAVDADVELVLVVGVVGGAGVVIGCCGEVGGCGEAIEKGYGGGVEWGVDCVVGELLADEFAVYDLGGGGVVDVRDAGEDALALVEGRDGGDAGDADVLLDALVVAEEEEAVVDDGCAERCAVEVAAVLGLAGGGGGEVVAGVEGFVAEEIEDAAVDGVGAGARGYVDDASVEAAELGGDVVGLDGELLNAIEDGEVGDLAGLGLECGDAVVEILVGAGTASVDAGKEGAGRKRYAGCQGCELDEVARVEGHRNDDGDGDVGLDVAGLGLQDGGVGVDCDGLLTADGEDEIDADGLAYAEGDAGAVEALEASGRDAEAIGTGIELGEEVVACGGGDGRLADARGGLGELDAGIGDAGLRGIEDAASEVGSDLSEGGGGQEKGEGG